MEAPPALRIPGLLDWAVLEKYFPAIENRASKGYNAEAIGVTFDLIDSQELERLSNNEEITAGYPLCHTPRGLQYSRRAKLLDGG
jgi:hypothetical protein